MTTLLETRPPVATKSRPSGYALCGGPSMCLLPYLLLVLVHIHILLLSDGRRAAPARSNLHYQGLCREDDARSNLHYLTRD